MTPEHHAAAAFDATMLLSLQGNPQGSPQVPTDPLGQVGQGDPLSSMSSMSPMSSFSSAPPMTSVPPVTPMTEVSQEMHGLEGELARLLQSAAASDAAAEAATAAATTGLTASGPLGGQGTPPAAPYAEAEPAPARRHRKGRHELRWRRRRTSRTPRQGPPWWLRLANLLLAAAAVSIVSMLSVLGGVISYEPLRGAAATGVSGALAAWWPLLIYGPWLVASLSILRAALHQRRVLHSWVVMILFSGLAVGLCVIGASREITDMAVAGLPPVSALIAFHQLVRQISLAHCPRHALPRPHRRI